MAKEDFLKICSRSYRRGDDDSDFDEEDDDYEEEEVEDTGGTTIPAPASPESDGGLDDGDGDPSEFPHCQLAPTAVSSNPVSVEDSSLAASGSRMPDLRSQLVPEEARWPAHIQCL